MPAHGRTSTCTTPSGTYQPDIEEVIKTPFGWGLRPHEIGESSNSIDDKINTWRHDWTIHDLRSVFGDIQHLGASRCQRNGHTPLQSATADRPRNELHTAATHEARFAATHNLWHRRHVIQKEKTAHRWTTVLGNLRRAGWGNNDIAKRIASMTQLDMTRIDGTTYTVTNTLDIALEAHQYYDSLFDPAGANRATSTTRPWYGISSGRSTTY